MSTAETGKRFFSQSNKEAWRNPWVIGWLLLLLTVLSVNIGMITTAVVTNPGLVEENYYEKGRDHEKNFQQRMEMRRTLGWAMDFKLPTVINRAEEQLYRFTVTDEKSGAAVTGATIQLTAYRPSDANADFTVPMNEIAPGIYEAKIALPLIGKWELKLNATHGEKWYDATQEIQVNG